MLKSARTFYWERVATEWQRANYNYRKADHQYAEAVEKAKKAGHFKEAKEIDEE
jgi:hypothetical protein